MAELPDAPWSTQEALPDAPWAQPQPEPQPPPEQPSAWDMPQAFMDRISKGYRIQKQLENFQRQQGIVEQAVKESQADNTLTGLTPTAQQALMDAGIIRDPARASPNPLGLKGGESPFAAVNLGLSAAKTWQMIQGTLGGLSRVTAGLMADAVRPDQETPEQFEKRKNEFDTFLQLALLKMGDDPHAISRPHAGADMPLHDQIIGSMPKDQDFQSAAKFLGGENTETNLRRVWAEQGIHPAEAVHDAIVDAFQEHNLTAKPVEADIPKDEMQMLADSGGMPAHGLGADVTTIPSPTAAPAPPLSMPARLMTAAHDTADKLLDIGRDAQMLVAPMARGTTDSMAIAKDFANALRRNRWEWSRADDEVAKEFTPERREAMWNAADEESVMRQLAAKGEELPEPVPGERRGFEALTPRERDVVEGLQTRAQLAWMRARDMGMVEGEGLPAYTPRMLINAVRDNGEVRQLPLNAIGYNLKTRTGQMLHRKYLLAEDTEAAAKGLFGDNAEIARDIRALPLATSRLEDAIAGRKLIDSIKEYGQRTGTETVAEGSDPSTKDQKWFTVAHPAFNKWRPKYIEQDGKVVAQKDAEGSTIFEKVPIYVRGDFEGPLRSVLTEKNGALYNAAMSLKAKTMSLIMNSPLIHNAVEWGRAIPAMPGKVATFKIYFEGNRAKNDPAIMQDAIDHGLVPIGHRYFNQDISSIMEAPNLTPGRSWTSQVLGFVPGLFDEAAGTAVKRAIDKAGDFWHNTLLWDRVADLQAGLYVNFRDAAVAKGVDANTASYMAAHWANRYAGALPQEAMSNAARKISNMLLFSRSFTMGNLGAIKDMLTGLPKDVLAQIERDAGFGAGSIDRAGTAAEEEAVPAGAETAVKYAKSLARRKAMSIVALDMGLMYIGNSVLQNAANVMFNDSTLPKEFHGYAVRFQEAMNDRFEHPLKLLQPLDFLQHVSATGENEPGKQDRIRIGYAKDGTAIYARNPVGKIGEEFLGYLTGPLDMLRRKLGTIARPAWQVMTNDAGFGRKVYDPDADTPDKYLANLGRIAEHFAASQFPGGQMNAAADLVKGEGDSKVNALQALGPLAGVTFAKGAPGGPAVGELYHARAQHDFAVQSELPDIRRQIRRGDVAGAQDRMTTLGIPGGLQKFYIRSTMNPATRLGGRTLRDFYIYATPEQKVRLERQQ